MKKLAMGKVSKANVMHMADYILTNCCSVRGARFHAYSQTTGTMRDDLEVI